MPFCPVCRSEFRKEYSRCGDCQVELVAQLQPEMELSEESIAQALEGKELSQVFRGSLEGAKETRNLLAGKHIASIIVEDLESPVNHGHPPRMKLLVQSEEIEKAAGVLGKEFKQMLEIEGIGNDHQVRSDACPACLTPLSEDDVECPDCGLNLGGN